MNEIINADGEILETAVSTDMSLAIGLTRAEIDTQIATARAYPRSVKRATDSILSLATLDEQTAEECTYALPRGGKPITGPSIRLAEIIQQCWGNNRVAARVVHIDRTEKFVEAEGIYHDLETNSATMARVRRRISGKTGAILSDDMIIVTGNAAASIAKRNAILGGVPKPVWRKAEDAVRKVVSGTIETLAVTREKSIKAFANFGIKPEQIFTALDVGGDADINIDHIPVLRGMFSALRNGEATVEEMFPSRPVAQAGSKEQSARMAEKLVAKGDVSAAGFDAAHVAAETSSDHVADTGKVIEAKAEPQAPAIDVEALISDARSAAMGGRREFDAWFLARTPEERTALEPEMKGLMAAAHAVDHPKKTHQAPELQPEAQAEPEPQPETTGPAFDFDVEFDAFEKQIAAIHTSAALNDFGLKVSQDAKGWFMAAPEAMQADARQFFADRLDEVTKAEEAAKRKPAAEAKAAAKAAEQAPPTAAEPSPLDEMRKAGSAAAIQGVRKYKLWRGKLNEQQFKALNGSTLDAELMELARKSDEDL